MARHDVNALSRGLCSIPSMNEMNELDTHTHAFARQNVFVEKTQQLLNNSLARLPSFSY